jgi:hypothetical protein
LKADGNAGVSGTDYKVFSTFTSRDECGKSCLTNDKCTGFEVSTNSDGSLSCTIWNKEVKGNEVTTLEDPKTCYVKEMGKINEVDYMPNSDE